MNSIGIPYNRGFRKHLRKVIIKKKTRNLCTYISFPFISAIKVKIKSVETDQSNGDKRLVTKKLRAKSFYRKENLSKRDIRKLQPVISGGTTCDCLSASPSKGNLFIMGTKRGNRFEISFLSEMVKDIGFISFVEAVEKGYTCKA